MSRSHKKNMGSTIACCKNVKDDRTIYHKLERAKVRSQLKHLVNDSEDEVAQDKVIKEKIDYGIVWADTWNWSSDGGSILWETDKDLRLDFKRMFADENLWYDFEYLRNGSAHNDWRCSTLKEIAIKLAPKNLVSEEELKKWIFKNENHIISVYKKTQYGK